MDYRYRVKGVAEKFFILNGIYFYASKQVDLCITEQELVFVQERCKLTEIVDLKSQPSTPKPVPNNSKEMDRGVNYEQSAKSTSRTNKVRIPTKV